MVGGHSVPERLVVIRPFSKTDEIECKKIASETIMSTVKRIFFGALFRETTFQLMVFFSAILFIFIGVPFQYCFVSVPVTITFLYLAIWTNTAIKSFEIQSELSLVKQQYQETDKTNFFVAEYFGPMIDFEPGVGIRVFTPGDVQGSENELTLKSRKIVGFLGVLRNKDKACSVWLKRLAIDKTFRRKGIATELLNKAANFCYEKGFSSIETCITECQQEAKEFLLHQGFELEQVYHKRVMGSTAVYTKYLLRKDLIHTRSALSA